MLYVFDWNLRKAESNFKKHRISFEEAQGVFLDDYARIIDDDEHSFGELRELIIGHSNNKLLIVSFTQRNEKIRIISARKVTKNERKLYEGFSKNERY